ncbi:hypothetical protein [Streptomyces sp. NPDC002104]
MGPALLPVGNPAGLGTLILAAHATGPAPQNASAKASDQAADKKDKEKDSGGKKRLVDDPRGRRGRHGHRHRAQRPPEEEPALMRGPPHP